MDTEQNLLEKKSKLQTELYDVRQKLDKLGPTKTYDVYLSHYLNCNIAVVAHSEEEAKEIAQEFVNDSPIAGEFAVDSDYEDTVSSAYYEMCEEPSDFISVEVAQE
jgi:hypothetical protein